MAVLQSKAGIGGLVCDIIYGGLLLACLASALLLLWAEFEFEGSAGIVNDEPNCFLLPTVGLCDTPELSRVRQARCIPWSSGEHWRSLDSLAEANGADTNLAQAAKEIWPSVQGLLGLSMVLCACTLLYSVLASVIPCVSSHPIKYANAFVMLIVGACALIALSVGIASDTMDPNTYEDILPASVKRELGVGYWACVVATVLAAARAIAFFRAN